MATDSIFRNIVINDKKSAERFVRALEKAARIAPKHEKKTTDVRELTTEEEIRAFFGDSI